VWSSSGPTVQALVCHVAGALAVAQGAAAPERLRRPREAHEVAPPFASDRVEHHIEMRGKPAVLPIALLVGKILHRTDEPSVVVYDDEAVSRDRKELAEDRERRHHGPGFHSSNRALRYAGTKRQLPLAGVGRTSDAPDVLVGRKWIHRGHTEILASGMRGTE
jgi:hypothetical protein